MTECSQNFQFGAGSQRRVLQNSEKNRSSEGTERSRIFFSGVSLPEMTGLAQNYEKMGRPPIEQAHHAGQRRPFRWWKARACILENSAWGKRMQSLDVRIAAAVQDE